MQKKHQEFYEQFIEGRFGSSQGLIHAIMNAMNQRSDVLIRVDVLIEMVGNYFPKMSEKERIKLLCSIDKSSGGVCDYASIINCIVDNYKDSPKEFEKAFGYQLTRFNGTYTVLNDDIMMADLYCFLNKNKVREVDGSLIYIDEYKNGINYLDNSYTNKSFPLIEQWLQSKGINKKVSVNNLFYNGDVLPWVMNENLKGEDFRKFFVNEVEKNFEKGNSLTIIINPRSNEKIVMKQISKGENLTHDSGGHAMSVIGLIDENNVLLDSWGCRYSINIESLSEVCTALFNVSIK